MTAAHVLAAAPFHLHATAKWVIFLVGVLVGVVLLRRLG